MTDSKNADTKLAKVLQDNPRNESYPDESVDYYDRFVKIDQYLNSEIHPHVNVGPTAREPVWLTDHGPEHISTVIRRAGDLVFQPDPALTPYECYILLLACHFHDVGNLFGRQQHEKKVHDVMFNLDETLVGSDNLEKRMICDAAMAHGGHVDLYNENKDTIGSLKYDTVRSPNGINVKKLAAILRFADELADDKTRTNRFVQSATNQVHPGSEIFHAYASHLRPVEICHDSRTVKVRFELNAETATRKYQKVSGQIYLFEEIMSRSLKMHREHVYCSRFMIPDVVIERVSVHIDICTNDYSRVLAEIKYTMSQRGYPDSPAVLSDICPELDGVTARCLVGRVAELDVPKGTSRYAAPVNLLATPRFTETPCGETGQSVVSDGSRNTSVWSYIKSLFGFTGNEGRE